MALHKPAYRPVIDAAYTIKVHVGLDRVSWFVTISDNAREHYPLYYGMGKTIDEAIKRAFDKLHDEPCER